MVATGKKAVEANIEDSYIYSKLTMKNPDNFYTV